jgi:hypothetical protein
MQVCFSPQSVHRSVQAFSLKEAWSQQVCSSKEVRSQQVGSLQKECMIDRSWPLPINLHIFFRLAFIIDHIFSTLALIIDYSVSKFPLSSTMYSLGFSFIIDYILG